MDALFYGVGLAYMVVKLVYGKKNATEVKGTVQSESAKSHLQVAQVKDSLEKDIKELADEIKGVKNQQTTTHIKLFDRLDRIDSRQDRQDYNLKGVCDKVGVKWVNEITILKGKKE